MDKYIDYSIALARLSKIAFMGGYTVETNDELILSDMADNNKAIIESLKAIKEYFVAGFPRATRAFNEYETELFQSADVKSLLNRMKYMEAAISKCVENVGVLTNADEYAELKELLGFTESPEEPEEETEADTGEAEDEETSSDEADTDTADDEDNDPLQEKLEDELQSYPDILKEKCRANIDTLRAKYKGDDTLITRFITSVRKKLFIDLEASDSFNSYVDDNKADIETKVSEYLNSQSIDGDVSIDNEALRAEFIDLHTGDKNYFEKRNFNSLLDALINDGAVSKENILYTLKSVPTKPAPKTSPATTTPPAPKTSPATTTPPAPKTSPATTTPPAAPATSTSTDSIEDIKKYISDNFEQHKGDFEKYLSTILGTPITLPTEPIPSLDKITDKDIKENVTHVFEFYRGINEVLNENNVKDLKNIKRSIEEDKELEKLLEIIKNNSEAISATPAAPAVKDDNVTVQNIVAYVNTGNLHTKAPGYITSFQCFNEGKKYRRIKNNLSLATHFVAKDQKGIYYLLPVNKVSFKKEDYATYFPNYEIDGTEGGSLTLIKPRKIEYNNTKNRVIKFIGGKGKVTLTSSAASASPDTKKPGKKDVLADIKDYLSSNNVVNKLKKTFNIKDLSEDDLANSIRITLPKDADKVEITQELIKEGLKKLDVYNSISPPNILSESHSKANIVLEAYTKGPKYDLGNDGKIRSRRDSRVKLTPEYGMLTSSKIVHKQKSDPDVDTFIYPIGSDKYIAIPKDAKKYTDQGINPAVEDIIDLMYLEVVKKGNYFYFTNMADNKYSPDNSSLAREDLIEAISSAVDKFKYGEKVYNKESLKAFLESAADKAELGKIGDTSDWVSTQINSFDSLIKDKSEDKKLKFDLSEHFENSIYGYVVPKNIFETNYKDIVYWYVTGELNNDQSLKEKAVDIVIRDKFFTSSGLTYKNGEYDIQINAFQKLIKDDLSKGNSSVAAGAFKGQEVSNWKGIKDKSNQIVNIYIEKIKSFIFKTASEAAQHLAKVSIDTLQPLFTGEELKEDLYHSAILIALGNPYSYIAGIDNTVGSFLSTLYDTYEEAARGGLKIKENPIKPETKGNLYLYPIQGKLYVEVENGSAKPSSALELLNNLRKEEEKDGEKIYVALTSVNSGTADTPEPSTADMTSGTASTPEPSTADTTSDTASTPEPSAIDTTSGASTGDSTPADSATTSTTSDTSATDAPAPDTQPDATTSHSFTEKEIRAVEDFKKRLSSLRNKVAEYYQDPDEYTLLGVAVKKEREVQFRLQKAKKNEDESFSTLKANQESEADTDLVWVDSTNLCRLAIQSSSESPLGIIVVPRANKYVPYEEPHTASISKRARIIKIINFHKRALLNG